MYIPLTIISDLFFALGICEQLCALADDITMELPTLNDSSKIKEKLPKIIELHSTTKELIGDRFLNAKNKIRTNELLFLN